MKTIQLSIILFSLFIMNFSFAQEKEELPSIGDVVYEVIEKEGVEAAFKEYDKLKKKKSDQYNFDEWQLNMLGYRLMGEDKIELAKTVFLKNIEQFPKAPNPYDSYAEACMKTGDKEQAIKYYNMALENLNAEEIDAETREWLSGNAKSKIAILEEKATAFDWFVGDWDIKTQILRKDGKWDEAEATSSVSSHAGGYLIAQDYFAKYRTGTALFSYNVNTGKWETTWVDNSKMRGFELMEGKCKKGECTFIGKPKTIGDKTKVTKMRWYNITDNSASWEEAVSEDEGKTWEMKLKMEYTRKDGEAKQ